MPDYVNLGESQPRPRLSSKSNALPDYVNIGDSQSRPKPLSPSNQRAEPIFIENCDEEVNLRSTKKLYNQNDVDNQGNNQSTYRNRYSDYSNIVDDSTYRIGSDELYMTRYPDSGYDTMRYDVINVENQLEGGTNIEQNPQGDPNRYISRNNSHDQLNEKQTTPRKISKSRRDKSSPSSKNSDANAPMCVNISLESPKIVKETEEASRRTSVQDRIKAFSQLNTPKHYAKDSHRRKSLDPKILQSSAMMNGPLEMTLTELKCSEAVVTPIKSEFTVTNSSFVRSNEALVKSVHEYNREHESQESSPVKKSEEIVSSKLSRMSLQKILFEENEDISQNRRVINDAHNNFGKENDDISQNRRVINDVLNNFGKEDDHCPTRELDYHVNANELEASNMDGNASTLSCETFIENEIQETEVPPRPPKMPVIGVVAPQNNSKSNTVASMHEFVKSREALDDDENWNNCYYDQLYVNNPLYPGGDEICVDIGPPPDEMAPSPPIYKESIIVEDNYLPMTPSKGKQMNHHRSVSTSAIFRNNGSNFLTVDDKDPEEHMYMEMNGDKNKSVQRPKVALPNVRLPSESPRYYEIDEAEGDTQHYEYIYRTGPQCDEIYMEVPGTSYIDMNRKPTIPKKPSDLKLKSPAKIKDDDQTSSFNLYCNQETMVEDVSLDADDEASKDFETTKDFESIETPKNKRFSLSDTFRPASYYLSGIEPADDPDAHDSSDSDLVSPPSIPTSPPPMEELNGDHRTFTYNFDSLITPEPPSHLKNVLDTSRSLRSRIPDVQSGKYSSPSYKMDKHLTSPLLTNTDFTYPVGHSNMTDNFRSEDHSAYPELDIITPLPRNRSSSRTSHDIMLSRDQPQTFHHRSRSLLENNSSVHGESLNLSKTSLSNSQMTINSIKGFNSSSSLSMGKANSSSYINYSISENPHNSEDNFSHVNSNDFTSPHHNVHSFSSTSVNNIGAITSPNHQRTSSDHPISSAENLNTLHPSHSRVNSNVSLHSPRSAPYYYSDTIKDRRGNKNSTSKKDVNNINFDGLNDTDQGINMDESKLEFEDRIQVFANYFEKNSSVPDHRNLYNANDFEDKFESRHRGQKSDSTSSLNIPCHRRSRSLEGVTDDPHIGELQNQSNLSGVHGTTGVVPHRSASVTSHLYGMNSGKNSAYRMPTFLESASASNSPDKRIERQGMSVSNLPVVQENWADDTEWRDQLRRASIRHTRSMETLDDGNRPPLSEYKPKPEHFDEPGSTSDFKMLNNLMSEYGYGNEVRSNHLSIAEPLEKIRRGLTNLEGYEWDPEEEKFRRSSQKSVSSTHLRQHSDNQHFLADCLPTSPTADDISEENPSATMTLPLSRKMAGSDSVVAVAEKDGRLDNEEVYRHEDGRLDNEEIYSHNDDEIAYEPNISGESSVLIREPVESRIVVSTMVATRHSSDEFQQSYDLHDRKRNEMLIPKNDHYGSEIISCKPDDISEKFHGLNDENIQDDSKQIENISGNSPVKNLIAEIICEDDETAMESESTCATMKQTVEVTDEDIIGKQDEAHSSKDESVSNLQDEEGKS